MQKDTIQERVQQFREHLGLTKKIFSQETGMNLSSIYRIETGETKLSKAFLNILKIRFAANPDWILTGEGEMFITPKEYIDKGIELLGDEKFNAGIIRMLRDPRYAKLQSVIKMENVTEENIDDELRILLQKVAQLWQQGDERTKKVLVQFVGAFPEVGENEKNK
jgi:transcriptional regulator with XRE-family HTH domain